MHRRLAAAALCAVLVSPLAVPAAGPEGYTYPLFDGRTLDGWIVTGCEAVVEDGCILLRDGNGLVRADHCYADFILELEWKALKPEGWDSGIYFRCPLPPKNAPWPKEYQVNLRQGMEGNVAGLEGAESKGLAVPGEWNRFRLAVRGTAAALEINGKPAWKADGLKAPSGHLALQAEVPGGGQFLFRNVRVTELGHRPLFNGKDLDGWETSQPTAEPCWKAEDGALLCTGKRGSWLRSREEFGDFNLRLQYRLKPGGNSGVYVRVPKDGAHHGEGAGIEVQILDDAAPRYAQLQPYQYTASLYAIRAADPRVAKPAGQWNTLEIDCRGDAYRVVHNGVEVVRAAGADVPALKERRLKGFLGLQNHSEEVWFRHLRIGGATE